jgi:hypothetical protein
LLLLLLYESPHQRSRSCSSPERGTVNRAWYDDPHSGGGGIIIIILRHNVRFWRRRRHHHHHHHPSTPANKLVERKPSEAVSEKRRRALIEHTLEGPFHAIIIAGSIISPAIIDRSREDVVDKGKNRETASPASPFDAPPSTAQLSSNGRELLERKINQVHDEKQIRIMERGGESWPLSIP